MKHTTQTKKQEKIIRKAVRTAYEDIGQSSAFDEANKWNLPYEYCKGCECETPVIDHECLICGQTTSPVDRSVQYWSIRSLKASGEDDALKALLDERFDESNPVCDKIVPQSTFDDMANSLSSAIYLLDLFFPDDELCAQDFYRVIIDARKSLENYNKITK